MEQFKEFIERRIAECKADTAGLYDAHSLKGIDSMGNIIYCKAMIFDDAEKVLDYAYSVINSYSRWMRAAKSIEEESEIWGMREIAEDAIHFLEGRVKE